MPVAAILRAELSLGGLLLGAEVSRWIRVQGG